MAIGDWTVFLLFHFLASLWKKRTFEHPAHCSAAGWWYYDMIRMVSVVLLAASKLTDWLRLITVFSICLSPKLIGTYIQEGRRKKEENLNIFPFGFSSISSYLSAGQKRQLRAKKI